MASFISGLSLLIIVLINGCFTLPITEIQFPDFTASPFYDDLTTETSFNARAVNDNDVFTTPFNHIKRSENEEVFPQSETNPTDLKRSLSELDNFDMTTATDVPRQERIVEEPFTFVDTTEQSSENKHHFEEPFTFTETTEQKRNFEESTTFTGLLPHEHETHHAKRVFLGEERGTVLNEKSDENKTLFEFTTISMPLFTSTSSAVAPELYTRESLELTSTQKYVGSLADPEEDNEEHKTHVEDEIKSSKKAGKKHQKVEKPVDEERKEEDNEEHETHAEDEIKSSKKVGKKVEKVEKPIDEEHREEEEEHNEKVVDEDETTDRKHKQPKSDKKTSEDLSIDGKYLVAELYDQDSSNVRATLPNNYAVLDESIIPVTAELVHSSAKKTKVSKETNKLNEGEESS